MSSPRLHREYREYRNVQTPPGFGSNNPPEWGGLVPIADWDPVNAVLSGSDVNSITDSSGNGNTLTGTGNTTFRPQYNATDSDYAGNPSISIAADNNGRRFTFNALTGLSASDSPLCFVAVCKSVNIASNTNRYIFSTNSGDVGVYHQEVNTRWIGFISDAGGTMCFGSGSKNPATPMVVLHKSGGINQNQGLYLNSSTAEQTATSGATTITYGSGAVGSHAPSGANNAFILNGSIARVMVFAADPNATQLGNIITALRAKYGV